MAGDWIKMTHELPDKPEVLAISGMTGLDRFAVVGRLFSLWRWFDQHTKNGNAVGVTKVTLGQCVFGYSDDLGFMNALEKVNWLIEKDGSISVPNFDYHISETAKTRAQTAKRVAKKRNADCNAASVTGALPREEKRREDITTPSGVVKRATQISNFTPNDAHNDFAANNGLRLSVELEKFTDYHKAKGSTMKDWDAAFRTWLRNAVEFAKKNTPAQSKRDHLQAVADQLTGRSHVAVTLG